jgi:antimicrobial peptide system SdpB family protein
MLTRIGQWARERARGDVPWTSVYGVARTLLALGTAVTLAFTHTAYLFEPAAGIAGAPLCDSVAKIGVFCLVSPARLEVLRWVLVATLLVIASGYRPRVTALLHWWIAFSLQNNAVVLDGGDQATFVLVTLMLPLALTDRRRWHWSRPEESTGVELPFGEELRRITGLFAMTLLRIQVAAIYFHAAVGKFGVQEWTEGTAVYYFFRDPSFGATAPVLKIIDPILWSPWGVCAICWGTLGLEYMLSAALFMKKKHWRALLVLGLGLHAAIVVVHGLVSFAFAMFAALIVYLRPFEQPFTFPVLLVSGVRRLRDLATRALYGRSGTLPGVQEA